MLKVQHWNLCLLHLTVPTKILPHHPKSMNTINCKITFAGFEIYCNTFVDMALSQDGLKLCSTCNKTDRGNSEGTVRKYLDLYMPQRPSYPLKKTIFSTQMTKGTVTRGGNKITIIPWSLQLFQQFWRYFSNAI